MCGSLNTPNSQITELLDQSQLSGVQSGTIVTGTFTLNGQSNLSGKIDLSEGSDGVPVWTLNTNVPTPSGEKTPVGEGIWSVLDNGYIKLTGKLTTAKTLGLTNGTYTGTIKKVTFTPSDGNAVDYGGNLFFKVIENQVVGLAIPDPDASKLSDDFSTEPDAILGKVLTRSLIAYDKSRQATSVILNFIDSEHKIWSKNRKNEVSDHVGAMGYHFDSELYNITKAFESATVLDGSLYSKL